MNGKIIGVVLICVLLAVFLLLYMNKGGSSAPKIEPTSNEGSSELSESTVPQSTGFYGYLAPRVIDWKCDAQTGGLSLSVMNTAGQRVTNLVVSGGTCDKLNLSSADTAICTIPNAQGCAGIAKGKRFESSATVSYVLYDGSVKSSTGTVKGAAE